MTEKQGMSKSVRALAGISNLMAVPSIISSLVVSSVKAAERHERACLELRAAVKRVQPILTPEGFVKLEELARVAARFQDMQGFLSAVGMVLGSRIECRCWWCRLKRWVRSIIGKLIVQVRGRR